MVDGLAMIEISDLGEYRLKSLEWLDFRLNYIAFESEHIDGLGQLVEQLPEINDVLVLVSFKHNSQMVCTNDGDFDSEEKFTIVHYQVLKTAYKAFYRQMVTEQLTTNPNAPYVVPSITDTKQYSVEELIAEWESLYDEAFPLFKPNTSNNLPF